MSDTNFSLLSQEEIDTLIEFLTEKTGCFGTEVLSQESIDKLIAMMKGYGKNVVGNHRASETVRAVSSVLGSDSRWVMTFEENSTTGYMEIFCHRRYAKGEDYTEGIFLWVLCWRR